MRAAGPAAPTELMYIFLIKVFLGTRPQQFKRKFEPLDQGIPFHLGQIRFYGQFVEFGEDFLGCLHPYL